MKRTLVLIIITLLAVSVGFAKKKQRQDVTIYAYGLSTSFNDTTAYITDIVVIEHAYFLPKTTFLGGRHEYSLQLKEFFSNKDMPNQTCAFFFSEKRDKLEKEYAKLQKRLIEKEKKNIVPVKSDDFTFRAIKYETTE